MIQSVNGRDYIEDLSGQVRSCRGCRMLFNGNSSRKVCKLCSEKLAPKIGERAKLLAFPKVEDDKKLITDEQKMLILSATCGVLADYIVANSLAESPGADAAIAWAMTKAMRELEAEGLLA